MGPKSKPEIAEGAEINVAPSVSENELTQSIIGGAIEVHRGLGPGLLESAYESSGKQVGLLINFNVSMLKKGVKRIVNLYEGPRPGSPSSASSALHQTEQRNAEALLTTPRFSPRLRVSAVNGPPQ